MFLPLEDVPAEVEEYGPAPTDRPHLTFPRAVYCFWSERAKRTEQNCFPMGWPSCPLRWQGVSFVLCSRPEGIAQRLQLSRAVSHAHSGPILS